MLLTSVENTLLPSAPRYNEYDEKETGSDAVERDMTPTEVTSASPSAPPLSSQDELLNRLLNDDGGSPSAPSYSQVCISQRERLSDEAKKDVSRRENGKSLNTKSKDVSEDGFIVVQNKKQRRNARMRIVGNSGRVSTLLKGASRTTDLYIGNCDTDVTGDMLTQYISDIINVSIKHCEQLVTRYDNYNSFKLTVSVNDKDKLLSPDVWPDEVVCRKYFYPRKTQK